MERIVSTRKHDNSKWKMNERSLASTYDLSYGYCKYASQVLMIFPTGTEDPHRYCEYASRLLIIFFTGTVGMPHRY